jgi:cysteinyl-tRNA synthetase
MAMKLLGETYDIHTSSIDLIFPHHENAIAISAAVTGKPPANYWLHNELVMINGKKTSKTNNNTAYTIRNIQGKGYSGREIRYWLLSRHYRKPISFSFTKLETAKNTISHLDKFVKKLNYCDSGPTNPEMDQLVYNLKHKFTESMDDDFNIAQALAALFGFTRHVNRIMDKKGLSSGDKQKVDKVLENINSVLGVIDLEPSEPDQRVEKLIKRRKEAREDKDWATADRIRHELKEMGIEVIDTRDGTIWHREDR